MAVVNNIREKVHLPIYDALKVPSQKPLKETEASNTLKFFVNVQGKTKLETNLQSASLLPHYNTFEARAMRVVISDFPCDDPKGLDVISRLIYNSVTTLYVGEKIMIQMPTWFFPAGAGPFTSLGVGFATHGDPSPLSTFRFAEPIFIDKQQNFRVEIEIPDSDVLRGIQEIKGPLFIWVVLDGYMTRDVQ